MPKPKRKLSAGPYRFTPWAGQIRRVQLGITTGQGVNMACVSCLEGADDRRQCFAPSDQRAWKGATPPAAPTPKEALRAGARPN